VGTGRLKSAITLLRKPKEDQHIWSRGKISLSKQLFHIICGSLEQGWEGETEIY